MSNFRHTPSGLQTAVGLATTSFMGQANGSIENSIAIVEAQVEILKFEAEQAFAPAAVWFEASNVTGFVAPDGAAPGDTYDPSFHEITYIWSVRGAPLAPYDAPENMLPVWNNPNLAYGKKVALTFPTAGFFIVDLWAIDATGRTAEASTVVNVLDADTIFPGSQTICFSNDPSETWADAKQGCVRARSVADVQNAINNQPLRTRVLLKRGASFDNFALLKRYNALECVGSWGDPALDAPIVSPPRDGNVLILRDVGTSSQLTFTEINLVGGWNSRKETGLAAASPFNLFALDKDQFITIHAITVDGFALIDLSPARERLIDYTIVVSNSAISNWRDYGIFSGQRAVPGGRFALLGNKIAQDVDALNGGPKNRLYNTHGPFRGASNEDTYIAVNDFFSRTGWSPLGKDLADQPCIRLNASQNRNISVNMDRNVCEGGFRIISSKGADTATPDEPGNYLFDKLLLITSAKTIDGFVFMERGGTTARNVVGIMPDTQTYHEGNTWDGAFNWGTITAIPENASQPIAVYSSAMVSLRNAADDIATTSSEANMTWAISQGETQFDDFLFENNILDGRRLITPVSGPLDLSQNIPGVVLRYKGVRYGASALAIALGNTVEIGNSILISYPAGTSQTDWQAHQTVDTQHTALFSDASDNSLQYLIAEEGDFTVSFLTDGISVTNTGSFAWAAGSNCQLKLDYASKLAPMDTAFGQFGVRIPLPVSITGSANSETGRHAYDDFLGQVRPGPGGTDHRQQTRASAGKKAGAVI